MINSKTIVIKKKTDIEIFEEESKKIHNVIINKMNGMKNGF